MVWLTGPRVPQDHTLYAAINEIKTDEDKISPSKIRGVSAPRHHAASVNEKKGLTFARGLRSILRHDPTRSWSAKSATRRRQIAIQSASLDTWFSPLSMQQRD